MHSLAFSFAFQPYMNKKLKETTNLTSVYYFINTIRTKLVTSNGEKGKNTMRTD